MRATPEFVAATIRAFKRRFPVTSGVRIRVAWRSDLTSWDGMRALGQFNTELKDWSPKFRYGFIDINDTHHFSLDAIGITLTHELLHCYFKKVGGLSSRVEEALCESSDTFIWAKIRPLILPNGRPRGIRAPAHERAGHGSSSPRAGGVVGRRSPKGVCGGAKKR